MAKQQQNKKTAGPQMSAPVTLKHNAESAPDSVVTTTSLVEIHHDEKYSRSILTFTTEQGYLITHNVGWGDDFANWNRFINDVAKQQQLSVVQVIPDQILANPITFYSTEAVIEDPERGYVNVTFWSTREPQIASIGNSLDLKQLAD